MIETLIAALLVSIGLLGYMQLLQANLKNTDSAFYRNQAAVMIGDIFDRMRANNSAAMDGSYNIGYTDTASGDARPATDINDWRSNLSAVLPDGAGAITCDGNSGACAVSVRWDDSRAVEGSSAQVLTMRSRLQ